MRRETWNLRREGGFTRLDVAVLFGVVVLAILLVSMIPSGHSRPFHVSCRNGLRQIGGLLISSGDSAKFRHSGAAFLLQIAPEIKDDQLKVFICPGDRDLPGRPDLGTPEFVAAYRSVEDWSSLDAIRLERLCSYAGPNWRDFPHDPQSDERRIWAADACRSGMPHHKEGICVLFDDGTVRLLKFADMEGVDGEFFHTGPDSPDPRLRSLCFLPRQ